MMTPPMHPRYGCFDPITGRSTMTSPRFALPPQMHQAMSRRSILTTGGVLLAAGASSPALAQAVLGEGKTPPHLRFLQPATSSKQAGYSHVVEATVPGRIIFIAGQMGLDSSGNVVGPPGDFKAQATQAYENIRAALAAAGEHDDPGRRADAGWRALRGRRRGGAAAAMRRHGAALSPTRSMI
jgi:enamine deaminase RidA (YjgF/YER057c/UK114 family)